MRRFAAMVCALGLAAGAAAQDVDPRALAGAAATVFDSSRDAFSKPLPGLDEAGLRAFLAGRRLFRTRWVAEPVGAERVGLGPLFNRASCSGCHVKDGRGAPPEGPGPTRAMVARVSHPLYGEQIQDQATLGVAHEARLTVRYHEIGGRFADGTAYSLRAPVYRLTDFGYGLPGALAPSPRLPPALIGMGLLEAVDEATLRALADPSDADGDGISGRLAVAEGGVGRFGWKAGRARLVDQVVAAAAQDIGLVSQERPLGPCTTAQAEQIAACGGARELTAADRDRLVAYLRGLAVPARRGLDDPLVARGEALFDSTGCAACHRPTLAAAGQMIGPYTDLLLHDMGDGLADPGYAEGSAETSDTGAEWRTAPLWGIGLVETVNGHTYFLHDGRARGLMEAVLWHGGEAAAAREAVRALAADARAALVAFLESL